MTLKTTAKTLALTVALAGPAMASAEVDYTAMREDTRVHNELLGASIAYLIDENCDALALRKLTLVTRAFALQNYAKKLGYTSSETVDYVESETEQDRFRAIAEPYLASRGAVPGDQASYCAIGREEMDKHSYVGTLLRTE